MICEKCGYEYEGKRCPVCRKNAVNAGVLAIVKAFFYSVAFVAIQFIVQFAFVIVKVTAALLSGMSDGDAYDIVLSSLYDNVCKMTILSSLVTILAVGIWFLARRRSTVNEVRLNPIHPKHLGLAALFGAVLQVVTSVAVEFVPWPQSWIDTLTEMNDYIISESIGLQVLAVVILGPITEELVFRGLVHTRLRQAFPPFVAAILSGVAFGIVHGTMIQFFYASLLGVVLGLVFNRYDSLFPCILIHIFFNGVSLLPYFELDAAGLILLYLACVAVTILCAYLIWFKKKDIQNGKESPDETV
ncbi:MAG: CPBP family intramembrane metalloprotease [Clostridia bacterium]|nr:CPBP family intramembrane metalloprotease [Clostridia bacterium]